MLYALFIFIILLAIAGIKIVNKISIKAQEVRNTVVEIQSNDK